MADGGTHRFPPDHPDISHRPHVLAVFATSMNSGKTTTATYLVHGLTPTGYTEGAGKVTGDRSRQRPRSVPRLGRRCRPRSTAAEPMLKRGGQPLDDRQRALVHMARAAFARPDVLVLDRIDTQLGKAELARVEELLADYPGVVLITSGNGYRPAGQWRPWVLD